MTGAPHTSEHRAVLYVIACGSPLARHVGRLVELAQSDDWDVCVVTTPDGAKFVDRTELARQTGHPVRTHYKNPGDPDVLPPADEDFDPQAQRGAPARAARARHGLDEGSEVEPPAASPRSFIAYTNPFRCRAVPWLST